MKTLTRLSVVDAVMYLILLGVLFSPAQMHAQQFNNARYYTAEYYTHDGIMCADFEKGIIDILKADISTRQLFFTELSEYIMSRFEMKVFDMQIIGDTEICYKYSSDSKKQNTRKKYIAAS